MNFKLLLAPVFLLTILVSQSLQAATYFMRADGTARNKEAATSCSGSATAISVKTHNKESFEPGDIIQLCDDGGVYKESIIAPSSGADGNSIIYKNVDDDTPVINLSANVGGDGWKHLGNGIYRKKGLGRIFWEDDIPLKAASSEKLENGDWFYPNGSHKLYYRPTSGKPSDHQINTIWFDQHWAPYAIDLRTRSNIEVSGITIKRVGGGIGHGTFKETSALRIKNIKIYNNNISQCFWAIWSQLNNNSVESDISIKNNTINYCSSGISSWTFSDEKPGHTQHHLRYEIIGNKILNHYLITDNKVWSDALLNNYWYLDHEAISFQDVKDSIIADNTIVTTYRKKDMSKRFHWTRAIFLYLTNGEIPTTGNKILRNRIVGHFYPAIYIATHDGIKGFENNVFAYNSVYYSLPDKTHNSFQVRTSGNPLKGKNYFVNNTIVNEVEGLGLAFVAGDTGNWVVQNNTIVSPRYVRLTKENLKGNLVFSHNLYSGGNKESWIFQLGGRGLFSKQWKEQGYDVTGSLQTDPHFVSKDDFHLRPDSPAIDAGSPYELGIDKDIEGLPIVGNPDMGAYEYQQELE